MGMLFASHVWAAEPQTGLQLKSTGFVEFGLHYSKLTKPNPSWGGQYAKIVWSPDPGMTWYGELANQRRFGEQGVFASVGATRVLNEDWYGSLFAGTSSGGSFLPKYRFDGSISRKWLDQKNLVTTLGLGYYRAKDVHRDESIDMSLRYYFDTPWIAEVGVRSNWSDPGAVRADRGRVAVTWGRDQKAYVTLRHEAGKEAYQIVGAQNLLTDFSSRETSVNWRQWVAGDSGFNVWLSRYDNPFYTRNSLEAGWFWGI